MSNMAINTNVLALNSHRSLTSVGSKQAKASTRLSSGYRINSAADDAAGLAISEKMRAQVRGLDMASKNSQDAVSLIQTAEGGMQEIDNMLQRTRELLVQVSNDTNDQSTEENESVQGDRQKIQDEISQLMEEIDSMADRVEFNKKKVINGSYADATKALEDAQAKLEAATDKKTNATTGTEAVLKTANENVKAAKDYDKLAKISKDYDTKLAAAKAAKTNYTGKSSTELTTELTALIDAAKAAGAVTISAPAGAGAGYDQAYMNATVTAAVGSTTASTFTDAASITNFLNTTAKTAIDSRFDVAADGTSNGATIGATAAGTSVVTFSTDASGVTTASVVHSGAGATDFSGEAQKVADLIANIANKATEMLNAKTAEAGWDDATDLAAFETDFFTANAFAAGTLSHTGNAAAEITATTTKSALDGFITTAEGLATPTGGTDPLSVAAANKAVTEAKLKDDVAAFNISRYDAQVKAAEGLSESKSLYFQVGANADQKLELNISSVKTDTLGLGDGKGGTLINVVKASGSEINHYMTALDEALTHVTTERSKLGAAQNRLEYTQKSLDISSENLTSAESRIRDTDMAKEMMNLTQANVLQSAATSMLAQANQSKQSILQLLQ